MLIFTLLLHLRPEWQRPWLAGRLARSRAAGLARRGPAGGRCGTWFAGSCGADVSDPRLVRERRLASAANTVC